VVTACDRSLTAAELLKLARRAAGRFRRHPAVVYLGANHLAYPVALFGAALADVPLVPVNCRLDEGQLAGILERHPGTPAPRHPGTPARWCWAPATSTRWSTPRPAGRRPRRPPTTRMRSRP